MQNWTLDPVISPLVCIAIFIGLVVIALLRPSFGNLTQRQGWVLSVARMMAILVLMTGLLRPGCVQTISKNQNASVLFFLDKTLSMEHAHGPQGNSRWDVLKQTITQSKTKLAKLKEQGISLHFFGFDQKLKRIERENECSNWAKSPRVK